LRDINAGCGLCQVLFDVRRKKQVMDVDAFSLTYEGNTYLIHSDNETVVDLGSTAIAKKLPIVEVTYIVLTHVHYDHTGGLGVIKTDAKIMMHEADAKMVGTPATASNFFGARAPTFNIDVLLKDGDQIDLGSSMLRVVHTPGHTPGSICLYEPESKSLFSGDTIFPHGGIGRTDLVGGSSKALVESIERLTKFDIEVLYPGHGMVTSNNVKDQIKQSLGLARAVYKSDER
jgi:hydroxyacylglutathione hydrolase